jgi:hypothetical protein
MQDGVQHTYWLLEDQTAPAGHAGTSIHPDLTQFFAEMEQKYPCPCPLDEE